MERLIKTFLIVLVCGVVGLLIYYYFNSDLGTKWNYDLPNGYVLRKLNGYTLDIGYKENNKFYKEINGKQVGLEIYIAEFQYSDNFIGLKCAKSVDDGVEVIFYIIDSLNQNVYGPYSDEETYLAVQGSIMDGEVFNDFFSTLEVPEGAYLN